MKTPLNEIMEFDHVIQVHKDGSITDSDMSVGSTEAYFDLRECKEVDRLTSAEMWREEFDMSPGWRLVTGFSGQYSYSGPVMHPSEFVGGGLERHIRETPGYYVVLEVRADCGGTEDTCSVEDGCYCEPSGWAVAYKESDETE